MYIDVKVLKKVRNKVYLRYIRMKVRNKEWNWRFSQKKPGIDKSSRMEQGKNNREEEQQN